MIDELRVGAMLWVMLVLFSVCAEAQAGTEVSLVRCGGDPKPLLYTGSSLEQEHLFQMHQVEDGRVRFLCNMVGLQHLPIPFTGEHGGVRFLDLRMRMFSSGNEIPEFEFHFFIFGKVDWHRTFNID